MLRQHWETIRVDRVRTEDRATHRPANFWRVRRHFAFPIKSDSPAKYFTAIDFQNIHSPSLLSHLSEDDGSMSKKFKSQASASSARSASAAFVQSSPGFGFGSPSSANGFQTAPSSLSYITEQPDLSLISNPHLVVTLRNLGKKDGTTKAKALEELQEHVNSIASGEPLDAGLLEAWIALYPRTSIDNARRVRQLTHSLQASLTTLYGKRIAPHLPKIIGAWLSGAYDSDRLVARAAQESISTAFNTEEKRRMLWKAYGGSLVDYANDAILTQTPQTLSDERSTTPDDAEAKFVRVVGNAVQMLSQVIKINYSGNEKPKPDTADGIKTLLGQKKLWEYASYQDPPLRKAVYSLATVCAGVIPEGLDWTTMSTCFIGKALHIDQVGSSRQLSESLLSLTSVKPQIWTTDYTSKTQASKRLFQFLRKGSQRGPVAFWSDVGSLVRKIPLTCWSPAANPGLVRLEDATTLLEALRAGITSNEEPRQNLGSAWSTYLDIAFWVSSLLDGGESKEQLFGNNVLPLVTQHVASDPDQTLWDLPNSINTKISTSILAFLLRSDMNSLVADLWTRLCQDLCNKMKLSQPESSKDFAKSQDAVTAHVRRISQLQSAVLQSREVAETDKSRFTDMIQKGDEKLVQTAVELLKTRNGKPYGAAAVLEKVVLTSGPATFKDLEDFLDSDAINLLDSPSAERLVSLYLSTSRDLKPVISRLTTTAGETEPSKALALVLRGISEDVTIHHPEILPFILNQIPSRLDTESGQQITKAVLQNPNLASSHLHKECCQKLLDQLSPDVELRSRHVTLTFLRNLLGDPFFVPSSFSGDMESLLTKVLVLSDSEDAETSELANGLLTKLKAAPTVAAPTTSAAIITEQLSGNGIPISLFGLIDLAKDTLKASRSQHIDILPSLLPTADQWNAALAPHVNAQPPSSVSITSSLRGLVFMIEPEQTTTSVQVSDSDGLSLLFRLALYTTKMLLDTESATMLSIEQLQVLYTSYPVALQVINMKLTMEAANNVWHGISDEITEEAIEILSQGATLIQKWINDENMLTLWMEKIRSTRTLAPRAYYDGLAFTDIASRFVDEYGPSTIISSFDTETKAIHRAEEVVRSSSLLAACRDHFITSQQGRRLLNELVAAATELKSQADTPLGLRPLVLLDVLLNGDSEPLKTIPSQRQVFLLQSLEHLLSNADADFVYQTMALKLLEPLVTATSEIYGAHWERILQSLMEILQNNNDLENDLPLLHAALRLYGRLKSLAMSDEPNEDLVDAWKAAQQDLEASLLGCLSNFSNTTNETNQPRQITAELLQRHLSQIDARHDMSLYSLLSSNVDSVRSAAYDLLHRSIPREQEQIALNAAVAHEEAHLPSSLLELLSDIPRNAGNVAMRRSYLLCWNLLFDHFLNAPHSIQEHYAADVKAKSMLGDLLALICDICRITSNRPLDVSKMDVENFELRPSDTEDQEQQRLAAHLYYCCLLYLPGPVRSWYVEQRNQIKTPLEAWTQKYFSPTLISAAAKAVADWAATQPGGQDEGPVNVKTSLSGYVTVASIALDEDSPPVSLAISLAKNHPLDSPTVESRTRVGVSEKNWQSWLRTIQIIIFSTGSMIDGLIAFHRNFHGALKGQRECAICYSIIGTDMQTANKRCGTCRNTFHGACLFRWFKSSNSSSCPLCRNNFNYT